MKKEYNQTKVRLSEKWREVTEKRKGDGSKKNLHLQGASARLKVESDRQAGRMKNEPAVSIDREERRDEKMSGLNLQNYLVE